MNRMQLPYRPDRCKRVSGVGPLEYPLPRAGVPGPVVGGGVCAPLGDVGHVPAGPNRVVRRLARVRFIPGEVLAGLRAGAAHDDPVECGCEERHVMPVRRTETIASRSCRGSMGLRPPPGRRRYRRPSWRCRVRRRGSTFAQSSSETVYDLVALMPLPYKERPDNARTMYG